MVRKAKKIMQKEKSQDGDVFPISPFLSPADQFTIIRPGVKVEQVNKNYALFDCQ